MVISTELPYTELHYSTVYGWLQSFFPTSTRIARAVVGADPVVDLTVQHRAPDPRVYVYTVLALPVLVLQYRY